MPAFLSLLPSLLFNDLWLEYTRRQISINRGELCQEVSAKRERAYRSPCQITSPPASATNKTWPQWDFYAPGRGWFALLGGTP
jgi:hypothetical protein